VKRDNNSAQGRNDYSNPSGSGEGASAQNSDRLVINVITGGPHPAGASWGDIERYSHALKYAPKEENVYVLEDTIPLKQQKTSNDDIIFRARDLTGTEAPTLDPLVITAGIGPAIVKRVQIDYGLHAIFSSRRPLTR